MGSSAPQQLRPVDMTERHETPRTDVTLALPARPENVAVVRHVLGAFAESMRLPDELIEDLRLAVTEACTNVVRHAYPDGHPGAVEISIEPREERVRIVVAWCELREGFRHFRTDRIGKVQALDKRYPRRRQALLKDWRAAEGIPEC